MGIELPDPADVQTAIALWRNEDARLEALLQRYDGAARALRHYGLILWENGDPKAAARALVGATALEPQDSRLWTDLSGALNAAGQLLEAAACMEQALLRDTNAAANWLRLGSIRNALDDTSGAEAALKTALRLDPTLLDARLSLGLICFHVKRFDEAIEQLGIVVQQAEVTPAVRTCYAQALAHAGRFKAAAAAFQEASESEPENQAITLKLAQARFIDDMLEGDFDAAVLRCRASRFVTEAEFETIARQAFHLLGAFGHRDAAIRLGEARLALAPEDAECAYLLQALRGEPLLRSPDRYVTSFFDQFAEEFDKQLVGVLGYTAYGQLATLVGQQAGRAGRILDLGCGTGLAGPLLRHATTTRLTGVDLSTKMLEKARQRGCYDELIAAEAVGYLTGKVDAFDVVFAADVLIYIGGLTELMGCVAAALVPGGLFALTLEAADVDLLLLPSGRFAHGLAHVLAQAAAVSLEPVVTRSIQIRYETQGFVPGELVILRKGAPAN